jgi:hypothetical protein
MGKPLLIILIDAKPGKRLQCISAGGKKKINRPGGRFLPVRHPPHTKDCKRLASMGADWALFRL